MKDSEIKKIIQDKNLNDDVSLANFLISELKNINVDLTFLSRVIELSNNERESQSAYYTNPFIIEEIIKHLPDFHEKTELHICEPSVGSGNFLPYLFEKYKHIQKVHVTLIDINPKTLGLLNLIYEYKSPPQNFELEFINQDFMLFNSKKQFDLIIGNPPFTKIKKSDINLVDKCAYSDNIKNLSAFFLEKSIHLANCISLVMPKNLLNTPEYEETRNKLKMSNIQSILDFGELGFKGVKVETINIICDSTKTKNADIDVYSLPKRIKLKQNPDYIFDSTLPYWVIYRDQFFDKVFQRLTFDQFSVFRDRQITNSKLFLNRKNESSIRVLKSRNISDLGNEIIDIENYDSYIEYNNLRNLSVYQFLDRDDVYLTPNMTYKPRLARKKIGYIVNGSIAILIPKFKFQLSDDELAYYASGDFRKFYQIARNYQTRTLNIDNKSVFWFGLQKKKERYEQ